MDFKKIKEQIRWIRRQYKNVVDAQKQEKEQAKEKGSEKK